MTILKTAITILQLFFNPNASKNQQQPSVESAKIGRCIPFILIVKQRIGQLGMYSLKFVPTITVTYVTQSVIDTYLYNYIIIKRYLL